MLQFSVNVPISRVIGYFYDNEGEPTEVEFPLFLLPLSLEILWFDKVRGQWAGGCSRGNSRNVWLHITGQFLTLETQSLSSKAMLPFPRLIFSESILSLRRQSLLTLGDLDRVSHRVREIIVLRKRKKET